MKRPIILLNNINFGGGAERSMGYLANGLAQTGLYQITYVSLEKTQTPDLHESIEQVYLREKFQAGKIHKAISTLLDPFKLNAVVERTGAKIVISFQHRSNIINVLTKLLFRKHKALISERNFTEVFFSNSYLRQIKEFSVAWFYARADYITCNASDIKTSLTRNFNLDPDIISVIHNGYPIDDIRKLAKLPIDEKDEWIFQDGKKVIVTAARLVKQKGHEYLIRAFHQIKQRDDYRLIIIGEGFLKTNLEKIIQELGLGNQVFLIGFRNYPIRYFSRASIFAFPSLYEGYPNSLCEAIIAKVPIVCFDFKAGAREILKDGEFGKLVPTKDTKAMADAFENPPTFHPEAISHLKTVEHLVQSYHELIINILSPNDKNTLIVFTDSYPFGKLESQMAFELSHLKNHFKKIVVYPLTYSDSCTPRNVPENVDVYTPAVPKTSSMGLWLKSILNGVTLVPLFANLKSGLLVRSLLSDKRFKQLNARYPQSIRYFSSGINWAYLNAFFRFTGKTVVRFNHHELYGNIFPYREQMLQNIDVSVLISQNGKNYLSEKFPQFSQKYYLNRLSVHPLPQNKPSEDGILRIVSSSDAKNKHRNELLSSALGSIKEIKIEWTHFDDEHESDLFSFFKHHPVDLFISINQFTGLTTSILGAMASHIPVMATDTEGIDEMVSSKTGILLPVELNSEFIVKNIELFYEKHYRQMALREQAYDQWEKVANAEKNYQEFATFLATL